MNKNTLLAFVLIAFTVIFFNSSLWNNFWYGAILKKPVPTVNQQRTAQNNDATANQEQETADIRIILPEEKPEAVQKSLPSAQLNQPEPLLGSDDAIAVRTVEMAEDTIVVETDKLIAEISTKGARIISLKMKGYNYVGVRSSEMINLVPSGSSGGAQLSINTESFDEVFFSVVNDDINIGISNNNDIGDGIDGDSIDGDNGTGDNDVGENDTGIINAAVNRHYINITDNSETDYDLILETKSTTTGHTVRKTFSFSNDTYRIGYTVGGRNLTGNKISLGWEGGIDDTEAGVSGTMFGDGIDKRRAHYSDSRTVYHFEMKKRGVEEPGGDFRWAGKSSKYFFIAVVAETIVDADIKIEGRDVSVRSRSESQRKSANVDIDYSVSFKFEAKSDEIENWIYAGPGRIEELSAHGMRFEKTLFPVLSWARHIFWADMWFPPLAELILRLLQFFYGLVKDYGLAIFLLTLLTKLVTYPLTHSSMKSMMRMKDLQPKIAALRQKHKNSPQKMNEEMMALYKAEGVNPFNPGCLPMFLQMPIFIALFVVLRKAIELRGATSFLLPWVGDLAQPEALFYLPGAGLPIYGNNVALMPIIMAALTFFQQKQTITDPNQKMIIYMMPILMLVMFNGFPAGVVFYWTVSSGLGLIQQMMMKKKNPTLATAVASGAPPSAKPTTAAVVKTSSTKKGSSSGKRKRR